MSGPRRWGRPYKLVNERLCKTCKCLEDEYHFVLENQVYDSLRRRYIDQFIGMYTTQII